MYTETVHPKINNLESKTEQQYNAVINKCREIFLNKTKDYGTSWRVLRTKSVTDQIFIKAKRIKTLEEINDQKIDEGIDVEFIGIINYGIIALIQLELNADETVELTFDEAAQYFNEKAEATKQLMLAKNHDYGEAWRDLRISSCTDLILMKLMRLKQIEDNQGKTLISEGPESHYMDIINYSVFALIKMEEE